MLGEGLTDFFSPRPPVPQNVWSVPKIICNFLSFVFPILAFFLQELFGYRTLPAIIPAGFTYAHDMQIRVCPCMSIFANRLEFERHVLTRHPSACRRLASWGFDPLTAIDLAEWFAARHMGQNWRHGYWLSYLLARWDDPFFPFRHPLYFFYHGC